MPDNRMYSAIYAQNMMQDMRKIFIQGIRDRPVPQGGTGRSH